MLATFVWVVLIFFFSVDAATAGDLTRVEQLLQAGANPNLADIRTGQTALLAACEAAQNPVVDYLVKQGADLNARSRTGETVLHVLVVGGNFDAALWMARRGASLHVKDTRGRTPMSLSAEFASLVASNPDLYSQMDAGEEDAAPQLSVAPRAVPVKNTREQLGLNSLASVYSVQSGK